MNTMPQSMRITNGDSKMPFSLVLTAFLIALVPVIGIFTPRFLAYGPAAVALIGIGLLVWQQKSMPLIPKQTGALLAGIVAIAALSHLWAIDPEFALKRSGKLAGIVFGSFLFLCLALNIRPRNLSTFKKLFPWAVLLSGTLCIFELYSHGMFYRYTHPDIGNVLPLAVFNRPGVIFALCLIPALYMVIKTQAAQHYKIGLSSALLIVTALLLYKTDSQSIQLSVILAALFYCAFPVKESWAWHILTGVLVLGVCSAPWLAQWMFKTLPPLAENMYLFQQSYAADRLEIWDFVSRRMFEHPFLGHGIEATRAIGDFDTQQLYHADTHVLHPHNFIIQIWIEFGALGAGLLCMLFYALIHLVKGLPAAQAKLALAVFMACLSISTTAYGFWQSWWIGTLFFVAGITIIATGSGDKPAASRGTQDH